MSGFLSSLRDPTKATRTKTVIAITALLIIVLALAAVVMFVLFSAPPKEEEISLTPRPAGKVSKPAAPPAPTKASSEETAAIELRPILTEFRDPFAPAALVAGTETTESAGGSGGSGGSSTSGESTGSGGTSLAGASDVLSLEEIFEREGKTYARVLYNGAEYTVTTGDRIGDSPYQITEIGEGSISLLYGDDRLELPLGGEIIK